MHNTMVYMSATSGIDMGGGSGEMSWIAPTEGPFENLALWSESTTDHDFGGQASLAPEGVFFVPLATLSYQGNGGQAQVAAQFIASKLSAGGNGQLIVAPLYLRSVHYDSQVFSELIR